MNLNEAREMFLSDLHRRSPNTIRSYDLAVRQVITHLGAEFDVADLAPEHIMAAVRTIHVRNVARTTLASYITGINRFVRFLILEGLVGLDMADLERLRERLRDLLGPATRRLPHIPTDDAVAALVEAATESADHTDRLALLRARDIALLHTLRSTGARVGEIVGLRRRDLIPDDKAAMVHGKGDKDRVVLFDDRAWRAVNTYLGMRDRENMITPMPTELEPVFARHDRACQGTVSPLTPTAVRNVLARLALEAGVDENIHPHAFRHRVGTKVLEATGNLAATQDILGHENPSTTRVYARLARANLREAHTSANL